MGCLRLYLAWNFMMKTWIIIPARGGSKTIPKKNFAGLGGRPLIDYVLLAAQAWGKAERIIVSTDDPKIAQRTKEYRTILSGRPQHLCGDDVPIAAVISDLLDQDRIDWPDICILLQPTSPFVLPEHLDAVLKFEMIEWNSFETIAISPHNHHEYNQRMIKNGYVFWTHPNERRSYYNKQKKPPRYTFGNLLAFKPRKFMETGYLFETPRRFHYIDRQYAHDIDDELDLQIANAMLETGIVKLEHIK